MTSVLTIFAAVLVALVMPSAAGAQSTAPECEGPDYQGHGLRAQMRVQACRHAHNVPADDGSSPPSGDQYLVISTKVRRPGVIRDGTLRYATFTSLRGPGQRVTWPMVFDVASGSARVVAAERCRMFTAGQFVRPMAVERAYITQVAGNGSCPPGWEAPMRALLAGMPGHLTNRDARAIRWEAAKVARAHGRRGILRRQVEIASVGQPDPNVPAMHTALVIVPYDGGARSCQLEARWEHGRTPIFFGSNVGESCA